MVLYRFNARFFWVTLTLAILVGGAVAVVHHVQMGRHAAGQIDAADSAESDEDLGAAVSALGRYLHFRPGDRVARSRHALLLARVADNRQARLRAARALWQATQGEPTRADLRLKLAETAFLLNDPSEAAKALAPLVEDGTDDLDVLENYATAMNATRRHAEAAAVLDKALLKDPLRPGLPERLADLYLEHFVEPLKADAVYDRLVAGGPRNPHLRLLRARYLMRRDLLPAAGADLAEARRLAPKSAEALAVSGEWAARNGRDEEAKDFYLKALLVDPAHVEARGRLARLDAAHGRTADALAVLRLGLDERPDDADLLFDLADLHAEAGDAEKAAHFRKSLPEAEARGRLLYLDGRDGERREDWLAAARHYAAATRNADVKETVLVNCLVALGRCYAALGMEDERRRVVEHAVKLGATPEARLEMARVEVAAGRVEAALAVLGPLSRTPAPPSGARPMYARALIRAERLRTPPARNWAAVTEALGVAAQKGDDPLSCAAARAEWLEAKGDIDEAREAADKVAADHPGRAEAWSVARRLGDARKAYQGAREALKGRERADWLIELASLPPGTLPDAEAARLEKDAATLSPGQRDRVEPALAEMYLRAGSHSSVARLCRTIAARRPGDLRARLILLQSRLAVNDAASANRLVAELRALEGPNGSFARYGSALVEIAEWRDGDRADLAAARRALAEARWLRPAWPEAIAASARLAEAEGRREEALVDYRSALDMRPGDADWLRRATALLSAERRFGEAEKMLTRARLCRTLDEEELRSGAEIALRAGNSGRAADLGRLAVASSRRTHRDLIWLGRLLDRAGKPLEAGRTLTTATESAPESAEAWLALVEHHDKVRDTEGVATALRDMERRLDRDRYTMARARADELLGRFEDAGMGYRAALKARPDDTAARERLARLATRLNQPAEAEQHWKALVAENSGYPEEDAPEARRQLALALTAPASGPERSGQALELIERNRRGGKTEEDERVAALVRASRPEDRAKALRDLETMGPGTPEERLRLAHLYDADGDWAKARRTYDRLIHDDPKNPAYLEALIDGLIRHKRRSEAEQRLADLERLAPKTSGPAVLRGRIEAMK